MGVAAAAGGTSLADNLTALGTVGAVIAAVWIALWTERRSGKRLRDERERSDRVLAEERERGDRTLADQRKHDWEVVHEEAMRRRSDLDQARWTDEVRAQLAQAYLVEVLPGEKRGPGESPGSSRSRVLAAVVVNGGSFTITDVEVVFRLNGRLEPVQPQRHERLSRLQDLGGPLKGGFGPSPGFESERVLTPWDLGIRFESPVVPLEVLEDPYPVVRWTDRWDTRWEHRRGQVRQAPGDGDLWDL